jgi:PadR family transcriptional regulator, regulatory protein AphA
MTTTEYAVLGLLSYGARSGYDLSRAAGRSIGYMWAPSRSQIYKVLPRLVRWGLAESREVEQQGRPDKAIHRITDSGLDVLRAWVERVEDDPPGGNAVFLLKIFFAGIAPPEAGLAQLDAYRAWGARRLDAFEAMERDLPDDEPVHSRIALRHGVVRARAAVAWADEARTALGGGPAAAPRPRASER